MSSKKAGIVQYDGDCSDCETRLHIELDISSCTLRDGQWCRCSSCGRLNWVPQI